MTDRQRQAIEAEAKQRQVDYWNARGGILDAGKGVKLEGDVAYRHKQACEQADRFADKNGKVNPSIQAIYAHIYGLV